MAIATKWIRNLCRYILLPSAIVSCSPVVNAADENHSEAATAIPSELFAIHGQVTYVEQETGGFSAPYRGPNSLSPNSGKETVDATLYVGVRLWPGAEGWINPEIDQGFGLDNTLGVAGFPSGEAYKVGKNQPYFRLPRLFVRETLDLDGDREAVAADNRWVFTVGKFSVVDIFDTNQYAHDPRNDFLNWAAVETGSFGRHRQRHLGRA
jgi:high affinity Mn2+ porin